MKQIENLWKERLQLYIYELRKYLKYIFNDHLLFVVIFSLGAGVYYYSGWVKTIDEGFPIGWVMGIVLGILLTVSPIYTLLKEADKVYLLPVEMKLKQYFKNAIVLSFMIQAYILLMVLAVCMPMYAKVTGNGFKSFFLMLLVLFIVKIWNLILHWDILKIQDRRLSMLDWIIRLFLNIFFVYFMFEMKWPWIFGVLIIAYLILYFLYHQSAKERTLKWDLLIDKEQKRLSSFYRFANLFTDVPKLKGEVKRRKWLDPIFNAIKYGQKNTYTYLFARTFIRSSEYFGLFIRLTIIGGAILYFSNQIYLLIGVALLFIYLTGFQLLPMIRYHELKIWHYLYPLSQSLKELSFLRILTVCIFIQTVIFSVIVLISHTWEKGLIVFVAGCVFSILFVKGYVPSRLRKMSQRH
ncbi:ABC transporter permease [Heyndrickxia sporothermodurans]